MRFNSMSIERFENCLRQFSFTIRKNEMTHNLRCAKYRNIETHLLKRYVHLIT